MKPVVFALPCIAVALNCHSVSKSASDEWCNRNCNHVPPDCPTSLCQCSAGPSPPPPSPGPPAPPAPPPKPSGFNGSIFELDLFVNDPKSGWQSTGFPEYLQKDARKYMNVAGLSFIQPADLMNDDYDLPAEVANVAKTLRAQGVAVQLLIGGEVSRGWNDLAANPEKASEKAIQLMKKYGVGVEIDDEAGGDADGLIEFVKLCYEGKPNGTHISMDAAGTPKGGQKALIAGAIDYLDWVNLMVSTPAYDQGNSVNFGHKDGIPYGKITVAYYAGTWVSNCNDIGSADNTGDLAAGISLFSKYSLKGLSVWAVGGASYAHCRTDDAPGFADAMVKLGARGEVTALVV